MPQESKEIYQLVLEIVYANVLEKRLVEVVPKGAFAPLFPCHPECAVLSSPASYRPRHRPTWLQCHDQAQGKCSLVFHAHMASSLLTSTPTASRGSPEGRTAKGGGKVGASSRWLRLSRSAARTNDGTAGQGQRSRLASWAKD